MDEKIYDYYVKLHSDGETIFTSRSTAFFPDFDWTGWTKTGSGQDGHYNLDCIDDNDLLKLKWTGSEVVEIAEESRTVKFWEAA